MKKVSSIPVLAESFGVPAGVLALVNGTTPKAKIAAGTSLKIPLARELYPEFRGKDDGRDVTSESVRYLIDTGVLSSGNVVAALGEFRRKSGLLLWPVLGGQPGSPFGHRWGRPHRGVDIPASPHTPILAAHDGEVVFAGTNSGYGNMVTVRFGTILTRYAHAAEILVAAGDRVNEGDVIATVGSTGRVTGPHLHFEVMHRFSDGTYHHLDPLLFFTAPSVFMALEKELEQEQGEPFRLARR